jgi:hypothetical protein
VSALLNGRLSSFSSQRLVRLLAALGQARYLSARASGRARRAAGELIATHKRFC